MSSSENSSDRELTIPVVHEQLKVSREVFDTGRGIRIHKTVAQHEETVDPPLLQDELTVERVPIGRLVNGARPMQRTEGQTLIIPVLEEVLVTEKRLRLKEEVRITRRPKQVHAPQTVRLQSEEVSVERFDEKNPGGRHG